MLKALVKDVNPHLNVCHVKLMLFLLLPSHLSAISRKACLSATQEIMMCSLRDQMMSLQLAESLGVPAATRFVKASTIACRLLVSLPVAY